MLNRLYTMTGDYPTAPYEMLSAWSLTAFAVAGIYATPDYAILSGHTPLHPPVWAWAGWFALSGLCRVWSVARGTHNARQALSMLSLCTWALVWLTLFWHHGGVAALCFIPPLAVADCLSFLQAAQVPIHETYAAALKTYDAEARETRAAQEKHE